MVVEPPFVCAAGAHGSAGGGVFSNDTVDTDSGAVSVRIGLASRALNALTDVDSSGSLPVLTRETGCTRRGRIRIAVNLTSHALGAGSLTTACERACLTVCAVSGWIGVIVRSTGRAEVT